MSTVIQIKRSTSGLAPNTTVLAEAELAYSQDRTGNGANAILYIESVDSGDNPVIHKVGGKYYTDIVDTATNTNTPNSLVERDASGNFSANVITANQINANISGTISGEASSAVIANTANALTTARTITLAGDLEGSALFDGTQNIIIYGNVTSSGVALGTDTTGDYVANLTAGTGIILSGQTGETANITVTLSNTGVAAGSYGGATNVPALVVDAQGRITAAGNAAISTTLNISGDTGSNVLSLINDTLTFDGVAPGIATNVTGGTVTFTNTGVTNVAATAGHIDVSAGTGNVSLSLPNTGVSAATYGGATTIPVIAFDAQGRATVAANVSLAPYITADSIKTLTNTTFDVSVSSNNIFSIQGQSLTSYSGSGGTVVLDTQPTLNAFNIGNGSQLTVDGGTGSNYWSGQSGVAQTGDHKAGVYATSPTANNSLFTFATNGSNYMSVGVEGSLFIGTALPSNNGGLNTTFPGWLVVQSGAKFGGDIDTLGGITLSSLVNGDITFPDGTVQNTAYTTSVLTTANVAEVTNLYFTNTRAISALTGGDGISIASGGTITNTGVRRVSTSGAGLVTDLNTGNITLTNTGVTGLTSAGHGIVASAAAGNVQLTFTGVGNVTGTANEIEVSAATGNVTIGLPTDVIISRDLTVGGNLTVTGNAIIVGTENLIVSDPLIHLANNNTSTDVVDIGFEGHYYAGATLGQRHAGLFRDASDNGYFKFFSNVITELVTATTVPTNDAGYTIGTVIANLTGGNVINLLNPIAVADGGTGRNTLTANAVLYGDGTNAVALASGTAGQVLQISAAGLVQFGMLDGGSY